MTIKIETKTSVKTNIENLKKHINNVLSTVPQSHLRGLTRIMLVDRIDEPRLDASQRAQLPGLYHPKIPNSQPWIELALFTLLDETTWFKRMGRKLAFRANITTTLLSLVAQHYYLTLSHGIKRSQIESAVKAYVEKQMNIFAQSQKGLRVTLLKPFRPILEKLAKWVRKRYQHRVLQKREL